ncbi:hypothetical protein AN214_00318 [Pseudoalteromonas sp. P1-9]|nr:hypothetical protein AN214_00318 [Pseudoalteromonas sp. P1-9]
MKMFGILANRLKDQAVTKISELAGKTTVWNCNYLILFKSRNMKIEN